MNWKEQIHLFANGKFRFIDTWLEEEVLTGSMAYQYGTWMLNENGEEVSDSKDCTLIARHISDMTDEEWEASPFMRRSDKKMRMKWYEVKEMSADELIYLLSIGVYPFDNTEDVIFKPKDK